MSLLMARGLSAWHGDTHVLRGIDLGVEAGETVALLGENGAGKSSLLLALAGHLRCEGALHLNGQDIAQAPAHRRARLGLGFCPEGRRVFTGMTVADNLAVAARTTAARARAAAIYALFPELERRQHSPAWQLSGGEQQMLALGRALMGEPRLLLLDEPFLGLAPDAEARLQQGLQAIRLSGVSILLADQDRERAESLCNRSIIIHQGQMLL